MTKKSFWRRGEDYAKKVSSEIIDQIKAGVAPWQKPWKPGEQISAENFSTGQKYSGGNSLYLMSRAIRDGRGDNRWGTYNQIREAGGQVRKGEKGTQVLFFTDRNSRVAKDEKGQTMKNKEGKTIYEEQKRETPICKQYTVFNVEQAEGLELKPREGQVRPEWDAHRDAEKVIAASGPTVEHVAGDRAYYRMAEDKVVLPEPSQFPTRNGYYQTALHECGHATGHPDRMNRETLKEGLANGFGSPEYAREELRAEISAMMTGERVGVGHDPQRGAAYVENWVKVLEKDPHEIHRAARDAQKMTDHLMERAIDREVATPSKEKSRAELTQEYSHARGAQISQTPKQSPERPNTTGRNNRPKNRHRNKPLRCASPTKDRAGNELPCLIRETLPAIPARPDPAPRTNGAKPAETTPKSARAGSATDTAANTIPAARSAKPSRTARIER